MTNMQKEKKLKINAFPLGCDKLVDNLVPTLSQGYHNLVTRLSQPCHEVVTTLSQGCHKLVNGKFMKLSVGCHKVVGHNLTTTL